eukprot:169896-Hanusia_phi.AAC.1
MATTQEISLFLLCLHMLACFLEANASRQPSGSSKLRQAAIEMIQQEQYEGAVELYKRIMEKEEAIADDYNNAAVCLQELDNLEESQEMYRQGIKRFYHK